MVKSFKAYDNIDEVCDKVIFEHEFFEFTRANIKVKK